MLTLTFILALTAILLSIVFYTIRYGISPMPSSAKAKIAILSSIPHDVRGKIYELGSGWGTLAIPLSNQFPHCQVEAYEISIVPWLYSVILSYFQSNRQNLAIHRQDFFDCSLKDATVVVCYLYPGGMESLKNKFEKELKPNTLVISNTFAVPGWTPNQVVELDDFYKNKIYIYQIQN